MNAPANPGVAGGILQRLKASGGSAGTLAKGTAQEASPSVKITTPLDAIDARKVEAMNKSTGGAVIGGSRPTTDVVVSTLTPASEITKPEITSDKQVLFNANGRSFGSVLPDGRRFRFTNGWLLTDDKAIIDYVRANSAAWGVSEEEK